MPAPGKHRTTVSVRTRDSAPYKTVVSIRAALSEGMARLREHAVPLHALAVELLLMHATGHPREWLYSHPEALLDPQTASVYFDLVAQRSTGTPTQYLTGKQEFWGMEFEVTPAVLIPRPETEHVIEVALQRIGKDRFQEPLRVVDIGTGSGCIGVALAHELPRAEIIATDISAAALKVAQRNARRYDVAGRIHFVRSHLLDGLANEDRPCDVIVSNPPYIACSDEAQLAREVREHEPREALFGGKSGTELYAALIPSAAKLLKSGNLLVLEIGYGTVDEVRELFHHCMWVDIQVASDLAGIPRVLSAERA